MGGGGTIFFLSIENMLLTDTKENSFEILFSSNSHNYTLIFISFDCLSRTVLQ